MSLENDRRELCLRLRLDDGEPTVYRGDVDAEARTLPASTVAAVLSGFEALGVDPDQLSRQAGVERTALKDPTERVPARWMFDLWTAGQSVYDVPDLGARVGLSVPFGALGILDYLFASAPTVRASLEVVVTRSKGLASAFTFQLRPDEGVVDIVGTPTPISTGSEFTTGLVVNRSRFLSKPEPLVLEVALPSPEVKGRPHEQSYRAPVLYGATSAWVRFAPEDLHLPLCNPDESLFATLDQLADKLGIGLGGPHLQALVRAEVLPRLAEGEVKAAEVARALGMSERSFYRRLSDVGETFRGLVDRIRAGEAERLLTAGRTILDVAHAVGYSDQAAFSRAFRRWRGESPTRWVARQDPDRAVTG